MTAKQRFQAIVDTLPDDASEQAIGRSFLLFQIDEGYRSSQEDPMTDNSELNGLMEQWLDGE